MKSRPRNDIQAWKSSVLKKSTRFKLQDATRMDDVKFRSSSRNDRSGGRTVPKESEDADWADARASEGPGRLHTRVQADTRAGGWAIPELEEARARGTLRVLARVGGSGNCTLQLPQCDLCACGHVTATVLSPRLRLCPPMS
jgi:hypothetical protein